MLKEKSVLPFADWNKELPKLVHDKHFTTIPAKFRQVIFEDFVKNYSEEFQKNKQEKLKILRELANTLFDEYDKKRGFRKKTTYQDLKDFFRTDKRLLQVIKGGINLEKMFNTKKDALAKKEEGEVPKPKEEETKNNNMDIEKKYT